MNNETSQADLQAARELLREHYGVGWLSIIRNIQQERNCSLDEALMELLTITERWAQ